LFQPIQTFGNAKFKAMLDIASRATKGITIPTPRKMRTKIIHSFKQKMYLLRERLNVRVSFILDLLRTYMNQRI
jgi:hypothetical protein